MHRLIAIVLRAATVSYGKTLILFLLMVATAGVAEAVDFEVGDRETVYTRKQRRKKKLKTWPDGNLGVVRNSDGSLDFYGANGPKPVKSRGHLLDPNAGKREKVNIYGVPKRKFNYVAGGPIYQDPATGARLMIYHAEKHRGGARNFQSVLGMAISLDPKGLGFLDLGTIIEPERKWGVTDVGGGSFAVVDDQLHVYYRDWFSDGTTAETAVARAPLADVIHNALRSRGTEFKKYHNGDWSQPGIGGLASPLETGNPANAWMGVSYNDHLDEVVMVTSQWKPEGSDLYLSTSPDGISWSARQPVALDFGEQFYPTLIGTGTDPTVTGESFYVYYTDSHRGAWGRWKDAELARRLITLGPGGNPNDPPIDPDDDLPIDLPDDDPVVQMQWLSVSDFADDFRAGTPADGWNYYWNSTGKGATLSTLTPLVWSDVMQAYNTTGGAMRLPQGRRTHNDDFLTLAANWGHPGRKKYAPIAGYTVQEDDGAGAYRLVDSTISKTDGSKAKKEDGLGVLVFVNDTLIGTWAEVSTNGSLLNFDRELGELNVGDTVWVMVDPLRNSSYDAFTNFDFSIQRLSPIGDDDDDNQMGLAAMAVPEPGTFALLLLAVAGCPLRRRSYTARR